MAVPLGLAQSENRQIGKEKHFPFVIYRRRHNLRSRFELRVDHVIGAALLWPLAGVSRTGSGAGALRPARRGARISGALEARSKLLEIARQLTEPSDIGRLIFDHFPDLVDHRLGARAFVNRSAVAQLANLSFDLIGGRVGLVARVDLFAAAAVFLSV